MTGRERCGHSTHSQADTFKVAQTWRNECKSAAYTCSQQTVKHTQTHIHKHTDTHTPTIWKPAKQSGHFGIQELTAPLCALSSSLVFSGLFPKGDVCVRVLCAHCWELNPHLCSRQAPVKTHGLKCRKTCLNCTSGLNIKHVF